jgi:hypothetical protein
MIPVTIHLDRPTFERLERIATREGRPARELIVAHLRASVGTRPVRTGNNPEARRKDVAEWLRLARGGMTNNAIARQYGVSKSLVSLELRAHGFHRQRPRHTVQPEQEQR